MKKGLVLISILLFLTGCEATYDLDITDDKLSENIQIFTSDMDSLNDTLEEYGSFSLKEMFDLQNDNFYPAYFDDENYNPYAEEKQDNLNYYSQEKINSTNKYGIAYNYQFDIQNIYRSKAINTCYKEFNVSVNDNIYSFATNGKARCFDNYSLLDKVTINIKTNHKVIYSNADTINENIYTWIITRDNASSKSIKLSLNTSKNNTSYTDEDRKNDEENQTDNSSQDNNTDLKEDEKENNTLNYILLIAVLVLFIIAIIGLIKYKSINREK